MVGGFIAFAMLGLLIALRILDTRGISEADKAAQIGALMGILQFAAALVTLWAAYKIAADQAARTEAAN